MSFLKIPLQGWVECLLFMSRVTLVIFFVTVLESFIIAVLAVIFRRLPDEVFQMFVISGILLMLSVVITLSCYIAIKVSK
jgi:hypothetical protein